MAIELTDHMWSDWEYSSLQMHIDPTLTKPMSEWIARPLSPALQDRQREKISALPPVEAYGRAQKKQSLC
jgi:hypothetical protein